MRVARCRANRIRDLALVLVLASAAHVGHAATPGPTNPVSGPLMLSDDEFWGDSERTRGAVVAQIAKSDFHGILLDAPKRVPLAGRDTLPVVGYFVRSLEDDRVLDQERQMVVVAVHQQTGQVVSGLALQPGKLPAPQATPSRNPGKGTKLDMFTFDLRRTLPLSWATGSYRITVVLGRFISNSVVVELAGERGISTPASAGGSTHIELVRIGTGNSGCKLSGQLVIEAPRPPAAGLAKVVLLVTGLQNPGPWTVAQDVTSTGNDQPAGTFGGDLMRSAEMPRAPGSYFVYAFSSWGTAGPVQCRVGGKPLSRTK